MKNICSMKTIAVLFGILFIFMGAHKAFASALTDQENKWLHSYLTDESSRPAVRMAFWMDIREQANLIREQLPQLVHENIAFVGIKYDGLKTLHYTYFINNPTMDFSATKDRMVQALCKDPQTILFLATFEGEFTYAYFLYGEVSKPPYHYIHIQAKDCASNGF